MAKQKSKGPANRLAYLFAILIGGIPAIYLFACALTGFFWAVGNSAAWIFGMSHKDNAVALALVGSAVAIAFAGWIIHDDH